MTRPTRIGIRSIAPLAAAALALVAATGGALAQSGTSLTVRRAPPDLQDRGVPPTFEQYPLVDRLFGPGGAIFPGYVPPLDNRQDTQTSLLTGGGEGRVVFAAGTADGRCQDGQVPTITVLSAPPGVRLATDRGAFIVRRIDAGSTYCLGRLTRGTRLILAGRPPRGGGIVRLQVSYPQIGRWGRSYTHVVNLPTT